MARYNSIVETIGHTPVVRVNRLGPAGVNLWVKIEAFNPLGSVKDRIAESIIAAAEASGALRPGQTVVESTSGNTGIGLAMVCAQRGYPLVIVMAESFSIERRKLLRFLGAKLLLTPASLGATGMVAKVEELAAKHGWVMASQFDNPANPAVHARTTAAEILADFPDGTLDYFVTGYGTGGTLNGVGRVLRERSPRTKIVVIEPAEAPLLASHVPQKRHADGRADGGHPSWKPHVMQGWTPNFISSIAGEAVDLGLATDVRLVSGPEAIRASQDLARSEGIFVGLSSGGSFAGGLAVAAEAAPGANILCMLADTGERYLSTPLFADIGVDMNEEERAIFASTPLGV